MPNIAQVGDLGGRRGNVMCGQSADRTLLSLTVLEKCLNQGLRKNYTMCGERLTVGTGQPANPSCATCSGNWWLST